MRYINTLQAENLELKEKLANINSELTELLVYLESDKFHVENWVSAREMAYKLSSLRVETLS